MSEPIRVKDLEVIGYADVLGPGLWPRVVPPIFRFRDAPDRVLMPPLRLEGPHVVDAWKATAADFEAALSREHATPLEAPFAARRHHVLWVDEQGLPRYEPAQQVAETLRDLSRQRLKEAVDALVSEQDERAEQLAQVAIGADPKCLKALLVKGFVAEAQADPGVVGVLARIAAVIDPAVDFAARLAEFGDSVRQHRFLATEARRAPPVSSRRLVARPLDTLAAAA